MRKGNESGREIMKNIKIRKVKENKTASQESQEKKKKKQEKKKKE